MKRLTKEEKNTLAQFVGQEIDAEITYQSMCVQKNYIQTYYLINIWLKLTQLPMKQQEVLLEQWKEQIQDD